MAGFYKMKAYLFTTKDPAIDALRTVLEDEYGRRIDFKMLRQIEENGGPRVATMAGWFFGDVKRPQSATIEGCGSAAGFERRWVRKKTER